MPRRTSSGKTAAIGRVDFPYMKDMHGRHAPIVYLQVWTGNRWLYLQGYVDSGASWSVFHLDVAQLLGLKLNRLARRYVTLGNGNVLPIYLAHIKVRFAGTEFIVPAGFSDALRMGFNLIGRAGFFSRFAMTFNDRARLLSVSPLTRSRSKRKG
jgi:hypothetical protein